MQQQTDTHKTLVQELAAKIIAARLDLSVLKIITDKKQEILSKRTTK